MVPKTGCEMCVRDGVVCACMSFISVTCKKVTSRLSCEISCVEHAEAQGITLSFLGHTKWNKTKCLVICSFRWRFFLYQLKLMSIEAEIKKGRSEDEITLINQFYRTARKCYLIFYSEVTRSISTYCTKIMG